MKLIGTDAIHALRERRKLMESVRPRHDEWKDWAWWTALGIVLTACALAW